MRVPIDPPPSREALLSLCRFGDADEVLTGGCRRLCAARGWSRAVLLQADPDEHPEDVLAYCGDVPEDAAGWAAGRPLVALRCFGRIVAFACGEPETAGAATDEAVAAAVEALLALAVAAAPPSERNRRKPDLLRALQDRSAGGPSTVSPLLTHPHRFQLAAQLPPGAVLVAAGGDQPPETHPITGAVRLDTPPPEEDAWIEALLSLVPAIVVITEGAEHRIVKTNPLARERFAGYAATGASLAGAAAHLAATGAHVFDDVFRSGVGTQRLAHPCPPTGTTAERSLCQITIRPYRYPDGGVRGLVVVATEIPGPLSARTRSALVRADSLADIVFDHCGIGLALVSFPELRILRHNGALTPLLCGEAAPDGGSVGIRITDLIAQEACAQVESALREAVATGAAVRLDALRAVFDPGRGERFHTWTLTALPYPGPPTLVIASAMEVTAQVQARAALESRTTAAEGRAAGLERALEAATDGMALFDGTGALFWRNAAYARLRAPEAEGGRYLQVQSSPDGRRPASITPDPVGRALLGETVTGETYLMQTGDGNSALDVSAWPLPGPRGSVGGALLLLHRRGNEDGEARRIADLIGLATRRSDALAAVIGSLSDGVLITDAEGAALLVNRSYCDMFGVAGIPRGMRERLAALKVRNLDGSAADADHSPILTALRGRPVMGARQRWRHARGHDIVVEISASPIREADGRIAGCVSVLRDVTRLQRLMEERDDFISVAAHELRTPLTTLLLETQLIERGNARGEIPSRWSPHLQRLAASAERLKKLVDGLIDVGRLERGVVTLSKCTCDLSRVAAEAAERFRALHPTHPLETQLNSISAQVDPVRLEQLLDNLMDNAAKYCPPGTPIALSLCTEDGQAVLAVADRGHGLPEADLQRVFTRYFRGSAHPARRYTGLGLGLFLARQIAELHGGEISAANRPGGGLRVAVRLPVGTGTPNLA